MRDHPREEILERFITSELPSEEARHVERHLSMCSECRDQADAVSARIALQLLDSWLRPSYDQAFERAADWATECLANLLEESRSTEDLLAELLREPAPLRRRKIMDGERFHSLKLCQLLLSYSRDARVSDPATSLEMANLAVEVALHLDPIRYGSSLVDDSLALAWAHLANAFRLTSDFWRAEQALRRAWRHHVLAEGDAYTEAHLLITTSSMRGIQGRYDEAVQLSDKAINLYRDAEDRPLESVGFILKGMFLGHLGRTEQAIPVILAGLDKIGPVGDPFLRMAGVHNLSWCLASGGEPAKARKNYC